jgi:hypothetical protein
MNWKFWKKDKYPFCLGLKNKAVMSTEEYLQMKCYNCPYDMKCFIMSVPAIMVQLTTEDDLSEWL